MQRGRLGLLRIYAAVLVVAGAAAQFIQGPVSCPSAAGFRFLRLHGSLERNLGRVARPANTTQSGWISYLGFVCSGLASCTGFNTLGWLKGEVAGFGVGLQWYALSTWDLQGDPAGICSGFYFREELERHGCPQASGYFFYDNKESAAGELALLHRNNSPEYTTPTTVLVATYGEECDSISRCVAFTSFGVLLGNLQVYSNWYEIPSTISNLYGSCVGLYVKIPQPMAVLGGGFGAPFVRSGTGVNLNLSNDGVGTRLVERDFMIPADYNPNASYMEVTFEGTYLPIGGYNRAVGWLELAQIKTNTKFKLWLGGPHDSRVARVTWYLPNVLLEPNNFTRFRIVTPYSGWTAVSFYLAFAYRSQLQPQLPAVPPWAVRSPPASWGSDPPAEPGTQSTPRWPQASPPSKLLYSSISSSTGALAITLPPVVGDRNVSLVNLTLTADWSSDDSRIVIRYNGTYLQTSDASISRNVQPGTGPMGQFIIVEERRIPILPPPPSPPSPPKPPPMPPSPPSPPPRPGPPPLPPRRPPNGPLMPSTSTPPPTYPGPRAPRMPPSPPQPPSPPNSPPEVPEPPMLELGPVMMRRLQQATTPMPPWTTQQQLYRRTYTVYTLPIEAFDNVLYMVNLALSPGSRVMLYIRTVNGGWDNFNATLRVEWRQLTVVSLTLPDMPSRPLLPSPPSPKPPSPRPPSPPRPPLPPSPPPSPPSPPNLPPSPPNPPGPPPPSPQPPARPNSPLSPHLPKRPRVAPSFPPDGDLGNPTNGSPPPGAPSAGGRQGGSGGQHQALAIGLPVAIAGASIFLLAAAAAFVIVARLRSASPRVSRISEFQRWLKMRHSRQSSNDTTAAAGLIPSIRGSGIDGSDHDAPAAGQRGSKQEDDMCTRSLSFAEPDGSGSPKSFARSRSRKGPPPLPAPGTPRALGGGPPSGSGITPKGTFLRGAWQGDLLPLTSFFPAAPAPQIVTSPGGRGPNKGGPSAVTGRATHGSDSGEVCSPNTYLPPARSRSSPGTLWDVDSTGAHEAAPPSPRINSAMTAPINGDGDHDGRPRLAPAASYTEHPYRREYANAAYEGEEAGWDSTPSALAQRDSWHGSSAEQQAASCEATGMCSVHSGADALRHPSQRRYQSYNDPGFPQQYPRRHVLTQPNLSVNNAGMSSMTGPATAAVLDAAKHATAVQTRSAGLHNGIAAAWNLLPHGDSGHFSAAAAADRSRSRSHRSHGGRHTSAEPWFGKFSGSSDKEASADADGCLSNNDSGQQPDVESNDEDSSDGHSDPPMERYRVDTIPCGPHRPSAQQLPNLMQPRHLLTAAAAPPSPFVTHHSHTRRSSWCGYAPSAVLPASGPPPEVRTPLRRGDNSIASRFPAIDLSSIEGVYRLIRTGTAALPQCSKGASSVAAAAAELPPRLSRTLSDPYMFTVAGQVVAVAAAAVAAAAAAAPAPLPKRRSRGGGSRGGARHSQEMDLALLETPSRGRLAPGPWSTPPAHRRLVDSIPGLQSAAVAAAAAGGPYARAVSAALAAATAATATSAQVPHGYRLNRSRSCVLPAQVDAGQGGETLPPLLLASGNLHLTHHPHRGRRRRASMPLLPPEIPPAPHNSPEDDPAVDAGQRSTRYDIYGRPKRRSFESVAASGRSQDMDLLRSAALRLEAARAAMDVIASVTPAGPVSVPGANCKTPGKQLEVSRARPDQPSFLGPRSPPSLDDRGPFAALAAFAATYGSGSMVMPSPTSNQPPSPPPANASGCIPASSSPAGPIGGNQPRSPPQPLAVSTPSLPRRPRYATELQTILSGAWEDGGVSDPARLTQQQLQQQKQQQQHDCPANALSRPPVARRLEQRLESTSVPMPATDGHSLAWQPTSGDLAAAAASGSGAFQISGASEPFRMLGPRRARTSGGGGGGSATAVIARLAGTTSITASPRTSMSGSSSGSCPVSGHSVLALAAAAGHSAPLPTRSPARPALKSQDGTRQPSRKDAGLPSRKALTAAARMAARSVSGGPIPNTGYQLQRPYGPFAGTASAVAAAAEGGGVVSPTVCGAASVSSLPSSRPASSPGSPAFHYPHHIRRPLVMASLLSRGGSGAGGSAQVSPRRQQAAGQLQPPAAFPSGSMPVEHNSIQLPSPGAAMSPSALRSSHMDSIPNGASTALSSVAATAAPSYGGDPHPSWATSTNYSATTASMQSGAGSLLNQASDVTNGPPADKLPAQPPQKSGLSQTTVAPAGQQATPASEHLERLQEPPQPQQQTQQQRALKPLPPQPLQLPREEVGEEPEAQQVDSSKWSGVGNDSASMTPTSQEKGHDVVLQAASNSPRKDKSARLMSKIVPEPMPAAPVARVIAIKATGAGSTSPSSDNTAAAAAWAAAAAIAMGMGGEKDGGGDSKNDERSRKDTDRTSWQSSTREGNRSGLITGASASRDSIQGRNMSKPLVTPPASPPQARTQQPPPREPLQPFRQKTFDLNSQPSPAPPPQLQQGHQQQAPAAAQTQAQPPQEQMLLVPAKSVDMDLDPNEIHIFRDGLLGQGAFGAVYRGVYRENMVAVKLLSGSIVDGRALQRDMESFHAELSILSRLRHKNIVRLYGGCMRPPCIFLVMQLMRKSLDSVIHHGQQHLSLRRALQLARDVAAGLSYLHPTIVHRDLKPANILIDEYGTAKISDFGLARYKFKAYLSTRTPDQGSVAYMAPECFNTDIGGLGPKTDIYSFGVLLWELLSGEYPWMGESNVQIIYKVAIKGERLPLPPADGTPFVAAAHTGAASYPPSSNAGGISGYPTQALVVPVAIRQLMEACFAHQPAERPDTHAAVCIIDTVLMELDSGKLVVQQPAARAASGIDSPIGSGRNGPGSPRGPVSGAVGTGGGEAVPRAGGGSAARSAYGWHESRSGPGGSPGSSQGSAASGGRRSSFSMSHGGFAVSGSGVGAGGGGGGGGGGLGGIPVGGGSGLAPAGALGMVGEAVGSEEQRKQQEGSNADALMAGGNQPQLATPFSNLDFLLD